MEIAPSQFQAMIDLVYPRLRKMRTRLNSSYPRWIILAFSLRIIIPPVNLHSQVLVVVVRLNKKSKKNPSFKY